MAFNVTVKPLRAAGEAGVTRGYLVTVVQTLSDPGETWSAEGLPLFGSVVAYQTRFTGGIAPAALYLRPELGRGAGFTFAAPAGLGVARYRRAVEVVRATAAVSAVLPEGRLYGRSGLSRTLVAGETLTTELVFLDAAAGAFRGAEVNGDWEIGQPSTVALPVATGAVLAASFALATPFAPVIVDGSQEVELWLDCTDVGAGTNPSDLRVRWQFRRTPGTGAWADVLWEDVANAVLAAGVATVPTGAYEVQDTLGTLTLPAGYPFSRHYIMPTRNWSGEVRAIVYNNGASATRAAVNAFMVARGG
jgi:hypothetical protein